MRAPRILRNYDIMSPACGCTDRADPYARRTLGDPQPAILEAGRRLICGRPRGTIVAMATEALRTVKDRFSEYVDRVEREHERVIVTRNGRPAIVLISTEDLEQLEETIDVLSDPDAMTGIREAEAAVARGDVVRGVDAVRALRPRHR